VQAIGFERRIPFSMSS